MSSEIPAADPDAIWLVRLSQGAMTTRAACDELYQRHAARILAWLAKQMAFETAQDVSQETWIRVYRAVERAAPIGNVRSWLFTVARNCMTDWHRKNREVQMPELLDPVQKERHPAEGIIGVEEMQQYRECKSALPAIYRDVIDLVYDGFSPVQIAERLNIDRNTVDQRKHKAVLMLRTCAEKKEKKPKP